MLGAGQNVFFASGIGWGRDTQNGYNYRSTPGQLAGQADVAFTACALVRDVEGDPSDDRFVFGNVDKANNLGWAILLNDQGRAKAKVLNQELEDGGSYTPLGLWQFIVLVYRTNNNIELYVNGVLVASGTADFVPASGKRAAVGADPDAGGFANLGRAYIQGVGFVSGADAAVYDTDESIAGWFDTVQRQQRLGLFLDGRTVGVRPALLQNVSGNAFVLNNQFSAFGLQGTNRGAAPTQAGKNLTGGASDTWSQDQGSPILGTPGNVSLSLSGADDLRPFLIDDPNPQWAQVKPATT